MTRALVFGRTGQLAVELARRAASRGVAVEALGRDRADLEDPAAAAAAVAATEADVVVIAAAYTAVDAAETDEARAHVVNADAPGAIAAACAARGLPLVHVSTDYVFDGRAEGSLAEDAPVAPLGAYGRTKLAGERAIAATAARAAVIRTSWVHAAHGRNFVRTMLRLAAERPSLRIVADQVGGPTAAADLADAVLAAALRLVEGADVPPVLHFQGGPPASWADFAEAIFEMSVGPVPSVERIPTTEFPTPAARPPRSVLDCGLIARSCGVAQPDWRASLRTILGELEVAA